MVQAASAFTVTPLLIDVDSEERDIIEKTITLTNHTDTPTRVYAAVNEVTAGDSTEILQFVPGSMSDRSTSITSWIEVSRARQVIPAQGSLSLPLTIRVNPNTPPGTYQALVGFASGANRDEIEQKILTGQGLGTLVKITIADKRIEQLNLVSFVADRFTLGNPESQMSYTLENTGDTPLTPAGEIIIYNTKGEELTAITVNPKKTAILPGERTEYSEALPFLGQFGKNKAYLSLNYGNKNQAALFDTAFYYSVPWYYIAGLGLLLLIVLMSLILLFRRLTPTTDQYLETGLYELPMFVKDGKDHQPYDHDLNLKNDTSVD